jgi:MscS family membrane protein
MTTQIRDVAIFSWSGKETAMQNFGFTPDQWLEIGTSVLLIAAVMLAGRWILKWVVERIIHLLVRQTRSTLDNHIWDAIKGPLYWFAVTTAFDIGLRRLSFFPESWTSAIDETFYVLYFILATVLILRLINTLFTWYSESIDERVDVKLSGQMLPFIRRVISIVIGTIALVTITERYTDVSAMLATLGVGSLAIALAAQNSLEDIFSGFMIMADRPFRVGDRIEIQDIQTWGDVMDIGLRSTRVRTRDNRTVVVPNGLIGKSMIVNHSYPDSQYRIQIELGLSYGTDIETARKVIVDAVREVDGVLDNHPVEALFLQFGDSALEFRVRWWLESYVDTRQMFDRVNTAIYQALADAKIEIPFPQREVHHRIDGAHIENIRKIVR